MLDKIRKIRRYAKGDIRASRKMTAGEILLRRLGGSVNEVGAASRVKSGEKPVVYH